MYKNHIAIFCPCGKTGNSFALTLMARAAPSNFIASPRWPQKIREIGPMIIWHIWVTTCQIIWKIGHHLSIVQKYWVVCQLYTTGSLPVNYTKMGHYLSIIKKLGHYLSIIQKLGHYLSIIHKLGHYLSIIHKMGHQLSIIQKLGHYLLIIRKEGRSTCWPTAAQWATAVPRTPPPSPRPSPTRKRTKKMA